MCLQPWQGGGKNQGMGHKESAGQDGRTEWSKRKLSLVKLNKVTFSALKEAQIKTEYFLDSIVQLFERQS